MKVYFEWRPYGGFVDNLNSTDWKTISERTELTATGDFSQNLQPEPGRVYEFRAVVVHPLITLFGDKEQFRF